ncbi:hypothetical protein M422DRAFT_261408 [Sphaerobolus stellatus SS14]|uniref:Ubiquitin-like protease family profile domain-containing protein n=1 Tax=Sphaerobolus stellatus (strain SS14) TaxID=990650 RepID=A0A0C9U0H1_SPHS4|nr:hypothetical protein M422DRAFT_261408 [Sphaerobolus stellatus SS14]
MSSARIPLAGSRRAGKLSKVTTRKQKALLAKPDYSFKPAETVQPRRQDEDAPVIPRTPRKGTILAMGLNETFIQSRLLPPNPFYRRQGASQAAQASQSRAYSPAGSDRPDAYGPTHDDDDMWGLDVRRILTHELKTQEENDEKRKLRLRQRYCRKKGNQYARWKDDIIPRLIPQYLRLRRLTQHGRFAPSEDETEKIRARACMCNKPALLLEVVLARWDRLEVIKLTPCLCKPVSEVLLSMGFFGCAPIRPSVAFDVNLLDLISTNMFYLAPNISGWGLTLEWFWNERGYTMGPRDFIEHRFTNTYQWYNVLQDTAASHVEQKITLNKTPSMPGPTSTQQEVQVSGSGSAHLPPFAVAGSSVLTPEDEGEPPRKRCRRQLPTEESSNPGPSSTTTANPVKTSSSRSSIQGEDVESTGHCAISGPPQAAFDAQRAPDVSEPSHGESARKRGRQRKPEGLPPPLPTKLEQAEAILLQVAHCVVAIDANFAQKCLKARATDVPLTHPQTQFIPQADLDAMDGKIEALRKKNPKGHKMKMRLPEEVLQECQDSFVAANEDQTKSSAVVFADTGLVVMVCRHDRILWTANMTTPGERQYYAFALLDQLFAHLPDDWHVGLLYDIACQVERSMVKHGILAHFYDRLSFAVSVFHAYGHQWPCQLLYHPRKVIGYGLSDGEGCERVWSSLKRLIPSLRVSGRHRRIWMIDRQIHHLKKDGLRTLVAFIVRKRKACLKRDKDARAILQKHSLPEALLREEWAAQVKSQTAPLNGSGLAKNAADVAVEAILDLRVEKQENQARILSLEKSMKEALDSDSDGYADIVEELSSARETFEAIKRRLQAKEKALGVLNPRKLAGLKGSEYLRLRMNTRAIKMRIRKKLVEQKFERARLERAYQRQVVRDKDHQQTKKLLKRSRQSITTLVSRYNRMVQDLQGLKQRGAVPRGVEIPMCLDTQELHRLDVDDPIWVDVMDNDGEDGEGPPRWLSDEQVRAAIPALLERDRVKEERERLDAEEKALRSWLRDEINRTVAAKQNEQDPDVIYHVERRLGELWNISEHWRQALDPAHSDPATWMHTSERPSYLKMFKVPAYNRAWATGTEVESDDDDIVTNDGLSDSELSEGGEEELLELLEQDGRREVLRLGEEVVEEFRHEAGVEDELALGLSMEEADVDRELHMDEGLMSKNMMALLSIGEGSVTEGTRRRNDTVGDEVHRAVGKGKGKGMMVLLSSGEGGITEGTTRGRNTVGEGGNVELARATEVKDGGVAEPHVSWQQAGKSMLLGFVPDISVLTRRQNPKRGRSCGNYQCVMEYIHRLSTGDRWFDGTVISVVAEAMVQAVGGALCATHITPVILTSMQRIMSGTLDERCTREETEFVLRHGQEILRDTTKTVLIPAHVPAHWTLFAIFVEEGTIRFFDSLPNRSGADEDEAEVRKVLRKALDLVWTEYGAGRPQPRWRWIPEERRSRQTNSYDCGAFVLADMASLIHRREPSPWGQAEMKSWRSSIIDLVMDLEHVTYIPTKVQEGTVIDD